MKRFLTLILIVLIIGAISYNGIKAMYPLEYFDTVKENCEKYSLDPLMMMSVIKAESNFSETAKSTKEANGLMQITEDTAKWCCERMGITYEGTDMLLNPSYNIKIGIWYYKYLIDRYEGNSQLAIAAYNAGIGNVDKWLSDNNISADGQSLKTIPFGETNRYINKIDFNYKVYKLLYGGKINE